MTLDIIMPCYYSNEVIRPAFEKICNQTMRDQITLIIVNDCSPNTDCEYQDIIQEYSSKIKIHYFKTPCHSGPGEARQLGLNHSTSDWVMFQDDDDQLAEYTTIEEMMRQIKDDNIASITGQILYKNIPHNIEEFWNIILCSVQGTIYNNKLIKQNNIMFEPSLSFKEEDGTFTSRFFLATFLQQHLKYQKCVYIRINNCTTHTSVTQVINLADSMIHLIGMLIYQNKYMIDYDIQDTNIIDSFIYPMLGGVPVLVDFFVKNLAKFKLKTTKDILQKLNFYIDTYFLILRYYKIDVNQISEDTLLNRAGRFYKDTDCYGEYDCSLVYNFKINYPQYLDIIQNLFLKE